MNIPNATSGIKSKIDKLTESLNEHWEQLRRGEISHADYSRARQAIEAQIKIEEENINNG